MSRIRWAGLLLIAALCAASAFGQSNGVIQGLILDEQGASIAGAKVTALDEAKKITVRVTTSGTDGGFQLRPLLPGTYTVKAEIAGFKSVERNGLVLDANAIMDMGGLTLQLGSVTESVTVQATAPLVETATGQKSYTINNKQVTELSTNGRDFSSLMFTLPGVASTLTSDFILGFNQTNSFSVNGARTSMNNVYLDGNINTDQGDNNSQYTQLSLDAVGEFKVQSANFNAEYGRNAGVLISANTKSGGNAFHGTLYEFDRNDALDANKFLNNAGHIHIPELRFNQFGGNLGGPIPVLGSKGNRKLFFFFNYEGTRGLKPNGNTFVNLPNPAALTGNFTSFLTGKKIATAPQFDTGTVFLPGSITRDAKGNITGGTSVGGCANTITAPVSANCNVIPANLFSTNAAAFVKILNDPSYPQAFAAPAPGQVSVPLSDRYNLVKNQEVARVDYVINPSTTFFFRWVNDGENEQEKLGEFTSTPFPVYPMYRKKPGASWSWNLAHVISPTMTNETIFGYDHQTQVVDVAPGTNPSTYDRTTLGFSFNQLFPAANAARNRFPAFNCAVASCNFGAFPSGWFNQGKDYAVTDNLTKVHGAHTLKTGVFLNLDDKQQNPSWNDTGSFDFSPSQFNPNESNNGLANLLMGNYKSYSQSNGHPIPNFRFLGLEFFGQDSWRVSRKVTVEFGMRYAYLGPTYTYGSSLQSYFDPGAYNPANAVVFNTSAASSTQGLGSIVSGNPANGMILEGSNGYPLGFSNHRKNNVAPRLSFAFDPFGDGKTAIRGGGGVFFERIRQNVNSFDGSGNPPLVYTPTLAPGSVDNIPSAMGPTAFRFPVEVRGFDRNGKIPTIYSWSLGIQRQLGTKNSLDVSYVGNSAHHLQLVRNINILPVNTSTGATPLKVPGGVNQALYPFKGYTNVDFTGYDGNSSYNALQARLSRRFAEHLTADIDYTWSKAIDQSDADDSFSGCNYALNCARDKGPAGFDRTHILTIDYVYQLPQAGTKLGNNLVSRGLLNGWEISGSMRFWSGLPLNITSGTGNPGTLNTSNVIVRANCLGGPLYPATQTRFAWFNTTAFGFPTNGTLGTCGRNILRGPGVDNQNFSLFKNTKVGERVSAQLRFEFFNVLNHTQFAGVNAGLPGGQNPGTPVTLGAASGTAGQISSTRDPRNIQLALKLYF